jgi:4-hydroxy-3-methylbut-2-enyl diphosphate reductase
VHAEARRFADSGHLVVLLGHRGHAEVDGTAAERPGRTVVVGSVDEAEAVKPGGRPIAVITQTTLSDDDVSEVRTALERRYGPVAEPARADRCYATEGRQSAVRAIAVRASLVIVVGSVRSSNAARLVEVAVHAGAQAVLVDGESPLPCGILDGHRMIGLSGAASTPEELVARTLDMLRRAGYRRVEEVATAHEAVRFADHFGDFAARGRAQAMAVRGAQRPGRRCAWG